MGHTVAIAAFFVFKVCVQLKFDITDLGGDDLMQGFGLFGGITNVENELTIIKSFPVVYQAIQELNLSKFYITWPQFNKRFT